MSRAGGPPLEDRLFHVRELSYALALAGVLFAPEIAGKLLEKAVAQMKESSTYQKILADGREEGLQEGEELGVLKGERDALLRVASRRLGEPDAVIRGIV